MTSGNDGSGRTTDLVLGALTFVTVAIPMATNHPSPGDRSVDAFAWLLPVVLAALLLVRRRWPVMVMLTSGAVLLGYYALRYPPVGLELPLAASFYTVAEAGRVWWGVGYGLLLQVFGFGARLAQGQDQQVLFAFEAPPAIAITAGALALGDATRQRRLHRLERARAEAAAALEHELEAERRVEQERVHLARELHDVLAHSVSVVSIQAGVAAEAIEDDDRAAAARSIASIRSTASRAMRDLRATLGILRGEAGSHADSGNGMGPRGVGRAPVGSLEHLETLADTARAAGVDVRVEIAEGALQVPSAVDTTAYRVVQEALTNVLRHSGASSAAVRVALSDGHLDVCVTDDGRGPLPGPIGSSDDASPEVSGKAPGGASSGGHGLVGMRERVALVGGTVVAGPAPGGGFQVRARLPL
ncbi:sensor histidine kinase [Intrasporangium sp.]|uniref:sensor histidine kinase n=1 Tax=Intrasporangium sp. TaxID=1925024 RepID=UPI00293A30FF|nr:histidine kinase [Intrasporangium sp.]MDV3222148.1 histidine kinase [Intrasporangium sp.]